MRNTRGVEFQTHRRYLFMLRLDYQIITFDSGIRKIDGRVLSFDYDQVDIETPRYF